MHRTRAEGELIDFTVSSNEMDIVFISPLIYPDHCYDVDEKRTHLHALGLFSSLGPENKAGLESHGGVGIEA
jgi:hypothetical protein